MNDRTNDILRFRYGKLKGLHSIFCTYSYALVHERKINNYEQIRKSKYIVCLPNTQAIGSGRTSRNFVNRRVQVDFGWITTYEIERTRKVAKNSNNLNRAGACHYGMARLRMVEVWTNPANERTNYQIVGECYFGRFWTMGERWKKQQCKVICHTPFAL